MSAIIEQKYLQAYSMFQGAPRATSGKRLFDRQIEDKGDIVSATRRQINYLYHNETDIGIIVRGRVAGVVGSKIKVQSNMDKKEKNTKLI